MKRKRKKDCSFYILLLLVGKDVECERYFETDRDEERGNQEFGPDYWTEVPNSTLAC